jgi:hypothetical protein
MLPFVPNIGGSNEFVIAHLGGNLHIVRVFGRKYVQLRYGCEISR